VQIMAKRGNLSAIPQLAATRSLPFLTA
jgi:hypothetical protein